MWLKPTEDKTEDVLPFKVLSQGLHISLIRVIFIWSTLQRDIWFSNNSKKLNCVTIKDILPLLKQELFLAKYSRISVLKMPGALAFSFRQACSSGQQDKDRRAEFFFFWTITKLISSVFEIYINWCVKQYGFITSLKLLINCSFSLFNLFLESQLSTLGVEMWGYKHKNHKVNRKKGNKLNRVDNLHFLDALPNSCDALGQSSYLTE